jgi:polynucleotide 5'-triphosphatase
MNADNDGHSDDSAMQSPVLTTRTVTQATTPVVGTIKARSSISSLTNDKDVDVDGKETPSMARRLSNEISTSESNSPIQQKKSISRAPSLQDMMNEAPKLEKTVQRVTPKKSVNDELETLDKLERKADGKNPPKSKNGKPRRYAKPPIWATKWVPSFKQQEQRVQGPVRHMDKGANHMSSITGVKPYHDTTRRITNWIYALIHSVPKEQREFLELEVKLGRLWHKQTDRRVHIPVTNECIIEESFILDCHYRSGMDKEHYERAKKFVTGLSKLHKDKFKTMKTDHIDRVYREASGGQIPRFYRLTTDKATGRLMANIEKKKLAHLHIHCPDLIFDYRLTMSIELPSNGNPERFENHTPETERFKKRQSVIHPATATRIDMTEVSQKSKSKTMGNVESLEMELEVDMPRLLAAFDNLEVDAFTFEELGETFMDNARIINRELIKPVPK